MTVFLWPERARARLLLSAALVLPGLPLAAQDTTQLDPIVVQTETDVGGTETLSGGSVSTIDGTALVETYGGDVATAVRNTPGAFTRSPSDSPAVSVNVRGMQGFGRVNTMIDGIPQTFRNMSGHGGSYDDQVYLDPGLLAEADIAKGAVAGAAGMGALAGAANFRTIGIDDLLEEGETSGGMVRLSFGDNGKDAAATFAGAMQSADGVFGGMAAVSGYNDGPYQDGDGTETSEYYKDEPRTLLAKMRYRPSADLEFNLTAQDYDNTFYPTSSSGYIWDVKRQSVVADMSYHPGNPLIDVAAKLYWQELDFTFPTGEGKTSGSYLGRAGTDATLGGDLSNTSRLTLANGELLLNYGIAYTQNDFDINEYGGSNSDGKLEKSGAFLSAAYALGKWDLGAGLRYDHYRLTGLIDSDEVTRSDGKWNPNLSARYHLNNAWSVYGSYAQTMRAPTVTEMFYGGGSHATAANSILTNPDLEAEKAETFEIGVNFAREGLWAEAVLFQSDIDDYIGYQQDTDSNVRYVNIDGTTHMRGLELSGGFENDRFFGSLAFTLSDTDQPIATYAGYGQDQYGELPDQYLTLDLGMKLLEGEARIGTRVRYVGESSIAIMSFVTGEGAVQPVDDYTVVDLYASWDVTDSLELYANIENVADTYYIDASTGSVDYENDFGGRGRTIQVGMTYRF
ncbi:TonB-dependent receptor domain-containing protein [Celeribacter sp. SCSIO 80788]|uniref:TonB-dependent receptor domain-containing protein n=1 Tax=Celeribacter sp. SCSIO 80788 TaxID=3117013 RepID=UPI003DA63806